MSAAGVSAARYAGYLKANLRDYGMLLSLVAIMAFFQVTTDGTLMQPLNLTNLVLQNSYIVIMALGMLLVIVAGHIDLSVGSVVGFIGALAAVLMVQYEMHFVPATLLCLAAGAAIGGMQGWFVAFFKVPSFIVTLAGMLVFKGLALALLQGQSVGPFPPSFQLLSSGFIPDVFNGETLRISSLVIGLAVALAMVVAKLRHRARQSEHGIEDEPDAVLRRQGRGVRGADRRPVVPAGVVQGPAQRAGRDDAADAAVRLRDHAHHDRPPHLRARRQREGGAPVGREDAVADLLDLRQHGRAGRRRRAWCSPRA